MNIRTILFTHRRIDYPNSKLNPEDNKRTVPGTICVSNCMKEVPNAFHE
jgi:hypothetical protein